MILQPRWMLTARYQRPMSTAIARYFDDWLVYHQTMKLFPTWVSTSHINFFRLHLNSTRMCPVQSLYTMSLLISTRTIGDIWNQQALDNYSGRYVLFMTINENLLLNFLDWAHVALICFAIQDLTYDEVSSSCYPLVENGTQLLNPCGLIANSFFNGRIMTLLVWS